MPPFFVVLAIEAHTNEIQEGQSLEITVQNTRGETITANSNLPMAWRSLGEGYPKLHTLASYATNCVLPAPGRYSIWSAVGGRRVEGDIEFLGMQPGRDLPPDEIAVPERGFGLDWTHLHFTVAPDKEGWVWLEHITDFYPTPRNDPSLFEGFLTFQIWAGSKENPKQWVRVELTGADGRLLRKFNDNLCDFAGAGPGHLRRAFSIMSVKGLVIPGPGDYTFRVFVDDQHIGSSEYPVIRVPQTITSG